MKYVCFFKVYGSREDIVNHERFEIYNFVFFTEFDKFKSRNYYVCIANCRLGLDIFVIIASC